MLGLLPSRYISVSTARVLTIYASLQHICRKSSAPHCACCSTLAFKDQKNKGPERCTLLIGSVVVKYPKYVAKTRLGSDVFGTCWC